MNRRNPQAGDGSASLEQHLTNIERLIVLALFKQGTTQDEIAVALQTSQATVSRMFPRTAKTKKT